MDRVLEMTIVLNEFRTAWMTDKIKKCIIQKEIGLIEMAIDGLARCEKNNWE